MKSNFDRFFHRFGIGQPRDLEFPSGQWRHVEFMSGPHENLDPGGLCLSARQAEMRAHADPFTARRHMQPQKMPEPRVHAVGGHHQLGAPGLAPHKQANHAAVFTERRIHARAGMCNHSRRVCGNVKQRLVQNSAALAAPGDGQPGHSRETPFRGHVAEVVAHAVERHAARRLRQSPALEHGYAGWH